MVCTSLQIKEMELHCFLLEHFKLEIACFVVASAPRGRRGSPVCSPLTRSIADRLLTRAALIIAAKDAISCRKGSKKRFCARRPCRPWTTGYFRAQHALVGTLMIQFSLMDGPREFGTETACTPVRSERRVWFQLVLLAMVALFILTVLERNWIRAHWWVMRLADSRQIEDRAYYLNSLLAVGDSATGAVRRLARHERADLRALAVLATARLSEPVRLRELTRLMADEDRDVAESAALALALSESEEAVRLLVEGAASEHEGRAACAASALSRIESPSACAALCDTACEHASALVRAQAIESVGLRLTNREDPEPVTANCDPVRVLVLALGDEGTFGGSLSFERQVAQATENLRENGVLANINVMEDSDVPSKRCVADVAAEYLYKLTGKQIDRGTKRTPADIDDYVGQCRKWIREQHSMPSSGTGEIE